MRMTKKQTNTRKPSKPKEQLPQPQPNPADWMGSMKGQIEIIGDIISPANDEDEWEVLRD